MFSLSVLAAFLGDIALDEEDLRLLKASYMDSKKNDSSNFSIPDSGENGCETHTAATMQSYSVLRDNWVHVICIA